MIIYFWAIGTLFMVLIFATKAGLVASSAHLSKLKIISLAFLYGMLSFLMGVILKVFNPFDYFQLFQKFISYGVLLHIFLSFGLFTWGLYTILFDEAMMFAVGLMVAIVSAYHLHEIFSADEFTLVKNPNQPGKMGIITKKKEKRLRCRS